jgi:hypothetical protein
MDDTGHTGGLENLIRLNFVGFKVIIGLKGGFEEQYYAKSINGLIPLQGAHRRIVFQFKHLGKFKAMFEMPLGD